MTQTVWYTARNVYDASSTDAFSWEQYVAWSKLTHLSELVSLDGMLNGLAFEPDFNAAYDWQYVITDGQFITLFYSSMDYVIDKTKALSLFNLLAVVREPNEKKADLVADFQFVGYDLIDLDGDISALTNCGGFDESFLPSDLNEFGLVTDYRRARRIQTDLRKHNPQEHHADCYLYEVWRHKRIGRRKAVLN